MQCPARIRSRLGRFAEDKLKDRISGDKVRIRKIFNRSEYEYIVHEGVEYEAAMIAYYEDETKNLLKIVIEIDDGGFFPSSVL